MTIFKTLSDKSQNSKPFQRPRIYFQNSKTFPDFSRPWEPRQDLYIDKDAYMFVHITSFITSFSLPRAPLRYRVIDLRGHQDPKGSH
jgi:hypothetical protein